MQTGITTDTLNSGNAVYAVATAPQDSTGVVAFGGAERALRLWDSRARSTENLVSLSLKPSEQRSECLRYTRSTTERSGRSLFGPCIVFTLLAMRAPASFMRDSSVVCFYRVFMYVSKQLRRA